MDAALILYATMIGILGTVGIAFCWYMLCGVTPAEYEDTSTQSTPLLTPAQGEFLENPIELYVLQNVQVEHTED